MLFFLYVVVKKEMEGVHDVREHNRILTVHLFNCFAVTTIFMEVVSVHDDVYVLRKSKGLSNYQRIIGMYHFQLLYFNVIEFSSWEISKYLFRLSSKSG